MDVRLHQTSYQTLRLQVASAIADKFCFSAVTYTNYRRHSYVKIIVVYINFCIIILTNDLQKFK